MSAVLVGELSMHSCDARYEMLVVMVSMVWYMPAEEDLERTVEVESGRRDGAAVATAVYAAAAAAAAAAMVVVVGGGRQSGRRWDGRGKGVAWTSRRLGKVGYRSHRRRVLLLWQHRCRC